MDILTPGFIIWTGVAVIVLQLVGIALQIHDIRRRRHTPASPS